MKTLIVIVGPTAVGKTSTAIEVAKYFRTEIVSADSRQLFKEMRIGTAVPESEELAAVPHHFIQTLSIKDYYSSYEYEQDVLSLLEQLFFKHDVVVLTGGSMLYIDAVCKGIDDIPTISESVREQVEEDYKNKGLEYLQQKLKELDPVFYEQVDLQNPKRLLHAVEVCVESGKTYSSLRRNKPKKRFFDIVKIGLDRDRENLYNRINKRVDLMLSEGLEDEVLELYLFKGLNALKTVGYKELFGYFDKDYDKKEAIRLLKRNSRHYAKRQLSWFRRDEDIKWFHPQEISDIIAYITQSLDLE